MELPPSIDNERPPKDAEMLVKAKWYDAHPEQIIPEEMNNFHLWVPTTSYAKFMLSHPKVIDKPRQPDKTGMHTPMWDAQTVREYMQTISDAVDKIPGLRESLEEIEKIPPHQRGPRTDLIELYKELRRQGYSHYDLVA